MIPICTICSETKQQLCSTCVLFISYVARVQIRNEQLLLHLTTGHCEKSEKSFSFKTVGFEPEQNQQSI